MRKLIALIFVAMLLSSLAFSAFAEEETPVLDDIVNEYVNTSSATVKLTISNSGTATITIKCVGVNGTTHISSTTCLEKWNGSAWVKVPINGSILLTESVDASSLLRTYTTTVGTGQYRATAVFTVTRGTDETITVRSNTVTH